MTGYWITRGRTTLGAMNVMTEHFTALQPPLRPRQFIRAFKIVQPHCAASIKFIAKAKRKNLQKIKMNKIYELCLHVFNIGLNETWDLELGLTLFCIFCFALSGPERHWRRRP